jgi:hypothetical protein
VTRSWIAFKNTIATFRKTRTDASGSSAALKPSRRRVVPDKNRFLSSEKPQTSCTIVNHHCLALKYYWNNLISLSQRRNNIVGSTMLYAATPPPDTIHCVAVDTETGSRERVGLGYDVERLLFSSPWIAVLKAGSHDTWATMAKTWLTVCANNRFAYITVVEMSFTTDSCNIGPCWIFQSWTRSVVNNRMLPPLTVPSRRRIIAVTCKRLHDSCDAFWNHATGRTQEFFRAGGGIQNCYFICSWLIAIIV